MKATASIPVYDQQPNMILFINYEISTMWPGNIQVMSTLEINVTLTPSRHEVLSGYALWCVHFMTWSPMWKFSYSFISITHKDLIPSAKCNEQYQES